MNSTLIAAGIPNSGKTTFLIALRYLLMSDEVSTVLEQTRQSEDETHFNNLEARWIDAERVLRTQKPTEAWTSLHVRDRENLSEADLIVPDLKGEHFEQPATKGLCNKRLYETLAQSTGLLLFINADVAADNLLISDVNSVVLALEDGDVQSGGVVQQPEPEEAVEKLFDPSDMPEDAKLVELLQMMNRRPLAAKTRKVALIVSAWDAVPAGEGYTPQTWVQENHPMLSQFLEHNSSRWEVQFYGVSAQGGVLPRDKDRLKKIAKPSQRIAIVGNSVSEHDLTAPVRWLMSAKAN